MIFPFPGGFEDQANGTVAFSLGAALYFVLLMFRPTSWRQPVMAAMAIGLLAVLVFLRNGPLPLFGLLLVATLATAAITWKAPALSVPPRLRERRTVILLWLGFYAILFALTLGVLLR